MLYEDDSTLDFLSAHCGSVATNSENIQPKFVIQPKRRNKMNPEQGKSNLGSHPQELWPLELKPLTKKKSSSIEKNYINSKHFVNEHRPRKKRIAIKSERRSDTSPINENCCKSADMYRNILGPTADESILAGLQTVIDLCGLIDDCKEEDANLSPTTDVNNLLLSEPRRKRREMTSYSRIYEARMMQESSKANTDNGEDTFQRARDYSSGKCSVECQFREGSQKVDANVKDFRDNRLGNSSSIKSKQYSAPCPKMKRENGKVPCNVCPQCITEIKGANEELNNSSRKSKIGQIPDDRYCICGDVCSNFEIVAKKKTVSPIQSPAISNESGKKNQEVVKGDYASDRSIYIKQCLCGDEIESQQKTVPFIRISSGRLVKLDLSKEEEKKKIGYCKCRNRKDDIKKDDREKYLSTETVDSQKEIESPREPDPLIRSTSGILVTPEAPVIAKVEKKKTESGYCKSRKKEVKKKKDLPRGTEDSQKELERPEKAALPIRSATDRLDDNYASNSVAYTPIVCGDEIESQQKAVPVIRSTSEEPVKQEIYTISKEEKKKIESGYSKSRNNEVEDSQNEMELPQKTAPRMRSISDLNLVTQETPTTSKKEKKESGCCKSRKKKEKAQKNDLERSPTTDTEDSQKEMEPPRKTVSLVRTASGRLVTRETLPKEEKKKKKTCYPQRSARREPTKAPAKAEDALSPSSATVQTASDKIIIQNLDSSTSTPAIKYKSASITISRRKSIDPSSSDAIERETVRENTSCDKNVCPYRKSYKKLIETEPMRADSKLSEKRIEVDPSTVTIERSTVIKKSTSCDKNVCPYRKSYKKLIEVEPTTSYSKPHQEPRKADHTTDTCNTCRQCIEDLQPVQQSSIAVTKEASLIEQQQRDTSDIQKIESLISSRSMRSSSQNARISSKFQSFDERMNDEQIGSLTSGRSMRSSSQIVQIPSKSQYFDEQTAGEEIIMTTDLTKESPITLTCPPSCGMYKKSDSRIIVTEEKDATLIKSPSLVTKRSSLLQTKPPSESAHEPTSFEIKRSKESPISIKCPPTCRTYGQSHLRISVIPEDSAQISSRSDEAKKSSLLQATPSDSAHKPTSLEIKRSKEIPIVIKCPSTCRTYRKSDSRIDVIEVQDAAQLRSPIVVTKRSSVLQAKPSETAHVPTSLGIKRSKESSIAIMCPPTCRTYRKSDSRISVIEDEEISQLRSRNDGTKMSSLLQKESSASRHEPAGLEIRRSKESPVSIKCPPTCRTYRKSDSRISVIEEEDSAQLRSRSDGTKRSSLLQTKSSESTHETTSLLQTMSSGSARVTSTDIDTSDASFQRKPSRSAHGMSRQEKINFNNGRTGNDMSTRSVLSSKCFPPVEIPPSTVSDNFDEFPSQDLTSYSSPYRASKGGGDRHDERNHKDFLRFASPRCLKSRGSSEQNVDRKQKDFRRSGMQLPPSVQPIIGVCSSQCTGADRLLEVRYAVVKISIFPEYNTYEIMKSSQEKPKRVPDCVEGIFVTRR